MKMKYINILVLILICQQLLSLIKVNNQGQVFVGENAGVDTSLIKLGFNRVVDGDAIIDFISDKSNYNTVGTSIVRKKSGATNILHFGEKNFTLSAKNYANILFNTNGSNRLKISKDGEVGIGTLSPNALLTVDGAASKPGGGDWVATSDARLKKNVAPFKGGLNEILKINPVNYQYNGMGGISDTETTYVGVLAQDLLEVAPYMVSESEFFEVETFGEDEDQTTVEKSIGDYYCVNATAIKYMLVNAIKEQQEQINKLNVKTAEMEEIIAEQNKILKEYSQILKQENNKTQLKNESQNITLADESMGSKIGQNRPNPFNDDTVIPYSTDENATSGAIRFTNGHGKIIYEQALDKNQKEVSVNASKLSKGIYFYHLIVDGEIVETRKMEKF